MTQAPTRSLENAPFPWLTSATSTRKMAQSYCEGVTRDQHKHQFSIICPNKESDFFLSVFLLNWEEAEMCKAFLNTTA